MDQVKIGFGRLSEIKSVSERFSTEREDRLSRAATPIEFGIRFLDESTGGIFSNDLIVLGAKTGAGKTELATHVALHNAKNKKSVAYFALEADPFEIERRIKYKRVAELYFECLKNNYCRIDMSYREWLLGKIDETTGKYEPEIDAILSDAFSTMRVFYRGHGDYTVDDFEKQFMAVKDESDLIIVDHLHFFDFDDDNENRAVKSIVKKCRDLALIGGKPIILIAHIRKSDRRSRALIPDIEDFHGASDISKIATKAIMLAPARDVQQRDPLIWPTFMRIAKSRIDGSVNRFVGLVKFNARTNQYEPDYAIGTMKNFDEEFAPITEKESFPYWAKSAKLL